MKFKGLKFHSCPVGINIKRNNIKVVGMQYWTHTKCKVKALEEGVSSKWGLKMWQKTKIGIQECPPPISLTSIQA